MEESQRHLHTIIWTAQMVNVIIFYLSIDIIFCTEKGILGIKDIKTSNPPMIICSSNITSFDRFGDNKGFVTSANSGHLSFWDSSNLSSWSTSLCSPSCLYKIKGHSSRAAAIHASSGMLISIGEDMNIGIWNYSGFPPSPSIETVAVPRLTKPNILPEQQITSKIHSIESSIKRLEKSLSVLGVVNS